MDKRFPPNLVVCALLAMLLMALWPAVAGASGGWGPVGNLGNPAFSSGDPGFPSLALDASGTPDVPYQDSTKCQRHATGGGARPAARAVVLAAGAQVAQP
jgi:hypothetical protein